MAALIMCLSPIVAAFFCGLFALCGDYPLAVWCLLIAPAGIAVAPYIEGDQE